MAAITEKAAAALGLAKPKARSKYNNRRIKVDGIWFDSHREAKRWQELYLLAKADHITELDRQVPFILNAYGGLKVGKYIADFVYREPGKGKVVEDSKGVRTPLYKWKARHILAQYGIKIRET